VHAVIRLNLHRWAVFVGSLLLPLACLASTDIEAMLQQADLVRSSNPARLKTLLDGLESQKGSATPSQLEHIQYLAAYRQAFIGNYPAAIRQARDLQKSTDINTRFKAGALIVNTYAINGQFQDGLRELQRTLALLVKVKEPSLREQGLIVAITTYNEIGQYQMALRYSRQLLSEAVAPRTLCFAAQYRLQALQNLDALPEDDDEIIASIDQCALQHEVVVANYIRTTLARKWAGENKTVAALLLLQRYLPEVEATKYSRLITEVHSLIGELMLTQGDIAGAEKHADTSISAGSGLASSLPLVVAYRTKFQVAERRNELAAALAAYKKYAAVDKAYLGDVKSRELAYQIVQEENVQKSQQISLLNRKNALLQLQQQVDQQSAQNSRLYMLLFALLAASVGYWAYKTKRMQMSVKRMAETDALTGVCNRHHFTLLAEKTLARSATAGEPAALVMFDLDHFKSINDSYGHHTGDWVLKQVAEACGHFCRRIDHLGRIGGEEFAILLAGCDLKSATRIAEDCRVRISRIDSSETGYRFPITASFGVSSAAGSGHNLDKLMSNADQMLYRAKREGRNRVRAYVSDPPIEFSEQAADGTARRRHAGGPAPESSAVGA
jgi:diguanylate cyclase